MRTRLTEDFYRLALASAKKRDLSRAVILARRALSFVPEDERTRRLLDICLFELRDTSGMDMGRMRELAAGKKWRKAEAVARAVKHQSVRIYNIRGCLCAASGRYGKAAGLFAKALEKDRGNLTAQICLIESLSRKRRLWKPE